MEFPKHESNPLSVVAAAGSGASAARVNRELVWKEYVERCSHQDAAALGELYDESSSLIYSLVLRILGNEADAEEVTLDAYTQVWRIASSYDPSRGNVTAWMVTIARSRALDRLRSRATRAQVDEPIRQFAEIPATDTTPEEGTILSQKGQRVNAALGTLPADQKQALELAWFSGYSHSELTAQLKQPLGTVKTRIRQGMIKLRELLGEYR